MQFSGSREGFLQSLGYVLGGLRHGHLYLVLHVGQLAVAFLLLPLQLLLALALDPFQERGKFEGLLDVGLVVPDLQGGVGVVDEFRQFLVEAGHS